MLRRSERRRMQLHLGEERRMVSFSDGASFGHLRQEREEVLNRTGSAPGELHRPVVLRFPNKPEFIILHHTDNHRKRGTQEGSIEATHANRGYPLSTTGHHAGYHYLIERSGKTVKLREENEEGAHAPEEKMNFRSIGIALAGDFQEMRPSSPQIHALRTLITEIRSRYDIPLERILLHREVSQTSCPVIDLRNFL